MADTMKFLWGANSKIPASSSATNGKAYFAIIDKGYTDTAAPTNEAFIYLDKAGARYNVIAKRAIFDSLGYKIVDKYFAVARNNSSNMLQFFAPSQNVNTATPVGSAAIITSIDLSNSSITAGEYKIKTVINGFEDTVANTANSTLSLGMASGTLAGLLSAGEQTIGGKKTFIGDIYFNNLNTTITTSDLDMNSSNALLFAENNLKLQTNVSIDIETNSVSIVSPVAINGNTAITGTTTISGQVLINSTNETALTATTGALLIGTVSGAHLSLDANEIQAKSSGTAATTLNLNPHGGVTQFGGAIYVASTAEASLTSGTGGIRVGSTSGTHLAIDGNEIQAKSSATAASALYLNPHGGAVYANTGALVIPVRASIYTSTIAGEIWIVA